MTVISTHEAPSPSPQSVGKTQNLVYHKCNAAWRTTKCTIHPPSRHLQAGLAASRAGSKQGASGNTDLKNLVLCVVEPTQVLTIFEATSFFGATVTCRHDDTLDVTRREIKGACNPRDGDKSTGWYRPKGGISAYRSTVWGY